MRKIPLMLLTAVVALTAAGPALAGDLSQNMEAYLASKAGADPVHGLIIMKDRLDIKALDWELHEAGTLFDERHYTVITALVEDADRAQASLLADLEVRRQLGEIDSYEPFWIINAVFVTAKDEAAIRDIALRDDVEVVEPPLAVELIEPAARGYDSPALAIGITPGVVNVGARRVWSDLGINGAGAIVCNLDTGVDGNHPALASRWRGNFAPPEECWLDFVGGFNVPPQDSDSHGTHTMGTMCGLAPNDTIGVAPGAWWIAANTIVGGNLGSQVLQTMQWLADPDGDPATTDDVPDVANNSWGVNENFGYPDCYNGWWAAIDACEAAGVVHVWATGNEGPSGSSVRSPADRASTPYDSFSVGATQYYPPYNLASFSSRGPAGPTCGPVENLIKPEVVAPGANIYSSVPGGGYQGGWNGTSMSTPHVAGVVALMRSANPDLDVITIKQILIDTANDLGTPGEDNLYGWGFLDAFEAVSAATEGYGTVAGTVVDDVTGLPIEGALVQVVDALPSDLTDELGGFRLVLPSGTATLEVTTFGYETLNEVLDIPAGLEIQPELRLVPQPAVTLSGVVYGPGDVPPGGTPAAGVVVSLADTPLPTATTGVDGTWAIEAPADVEYTVRASLPGQGSVVQTLPATADHDCALYLRASVEDGFESGDFGSFPWVFAGNADWVVSDEDAHEGVYSARSGQISDSESSILRLDIDVVEDGEVTFWFRTQGGASTFSFWDGFATIESWESVSDWTFFSYPVTAGAHTFRWRVSTTSGGGTGDLAFVDLIKFPGGDPDAPRAVACPEGVTVEVAVGGTAAGELLVLNEGVEDLNWTLSDALPNVGIDNAGGTLAPAGYAVVGLDVDAVGLAEGNHVFNLYLASNDPDNPSLAVPVTVVVGDTPLPVGDTPAAFELAGAVPNPFNPMTVVHFSLPATQDARLNVYDVQGRLVRSLLDEVRPAGANQVTWDGRDHSGRGVASGTYFARLESGAQTSVKSMVLVR